MPTVVLLLDTFGGGARALGGKWRVYLGYWGQGKLEGELGGALVELELLLLRLLLVCVRGAAVLRDERVHGCGCVAMECVCVGVAGEWERAVVVAVVVVVVDMIWEPLHQASSRTSCCRPRQAKPQVRTLHSTPTDAASAACLLRPAHLTPHATYLCLHIAQQAIISQQQLRRSGWRHLCSSVLLVKVQLRPSLVILSLSNSSIDSS